MIDLSGKAAAHTGTASGIGAKVVRALVRAFVRLALSGTQTGLLAHFSLVAEQWTRLNDAALARMGGLDFQRYRIQAAIYPLACAPFTRTRSVLEPQRLPIFKPKKIMAITRH